MKVSIADFKNAVMMFEAKVIESQTTSMNKFAMGVALARYGKDIDKMVAPFMDGSGMVDVDMLKGYVDAGMKAAGGELTVEPQLDPNLRVLGVSIKNIKFSKDDFDEFFTKTIPQVSPSAIQ